MGQLVCPRVEFRIGQLLAAADKRAGFGRSRRLLLEEFVDATVARKVAARVVPLEEELVSLFISEQRQGAEARGRIGYGSVEQHREVLEHPPDGRAVKEVGVVLQRAQQAVRTLNHVEREIERRHLRLLV